MAAVAVDDGADEDSILIKDLFENAEHDVVGTCLRSLLYIVNNVTYFTNQVVFNRIDFSERIQVNGYAMNAPRGLVATSNSLLPTTPTPWLPYSIRSMHSVSV